MATSGQSTGTMQVSEVIAAAFQELAVYSAGEQPTGEDTKLAIRSLNWMLKSWQGRGITSWRDTEGAILFPASTATVTLTPYCTDVTEARLVQNSTFERPLQRWELGQYRQIPNKQIKGNPVAYTIGKTDNAITMTLWPIPNTDMTVLYSYSRVPDDVTDPSQTLDIPQDWLEAVYTGLAARLVQSFGVTRIDPNAAKIIAQRAASLEQLLLDADRPASIYLGGYSERFF